MKSRRWHPLALSFYTIAICSLLPFFIYGQEKKTIKGIVYTSNSNTPLVGVRVFQKGTDHHVMTTTTGAYLIEVDRESTLVFFLRGYEGKEVFVKKGAKESVLSTRLALANDVRMAPNVIFILADDLGWTQTGPYGNRYYKTPNIDRLANEGICFTQAYAAAAVCSPTRASIMTGKYPARLHLTDYIPGLKTEGMPLKTPGWQRFLPLKEYTLGELFREKDYRTALFGKWHLSMAKAPPESAPHDPDKQGFDEFMITYKPHGNPFKPTDPEHDPHMSDSTGWRSVEFIKRYSDKPFFLFMSFNAIHDPLMEKKDSIAAWSKREGSNAPENNPVIGAMMKRMDDNIGKVLHTLDSLGLKEHTIVVFFSDNGGFEYDATQTPLRRGKGWFYEGGIREPLIIRWPGVIAPGRRSQAVVSSIDFLPTFAELIGVTPAEPVDGISILTHLKTKADLPGRNLTGIIRTT